jgi:hypothetical protein
MPGASDQVTITARRTLLDVLDLLGTHRAAVILVGAQAIYLHIGQAAGTAQFTKDADLAIDPRSLAAEPKIEELLRAAGYASKPDWPGVWRKDVTGSQVDFLVPEALSGRGKRSAKLSAQGDRLALRAAGLEGALVDHSPMKIAALEPADNRRFDIAVAGPSALLVAKLWKLGEREVRRPDRMYDKDAMDVFLLLRHIPLRRLVEGFHHLRENPLSADAAHETARYLLHLFGSDTATGTVMAARALEVVEDPRQIRVASAILATDLLTGIGLDTT